MSKAKQLQLNGANGNDNRRELDFYPTPEDVTIALMDFINLPLSAVWEPACGDGSMSKIIECYGHEVISSDIRETGYGESNVNFLERVKDVNAIITNPPFNLSSDFITHAVEQCPIVAMLLKSQYWHAKTRYELFNSYPPAYVLPLTWRPDFLSGERGGKPTMECIWTVWIEGNTRSKYQPLMKPSDSGYRLAKAIMDFEEVTN